MKNLQSFLCVLVCLSFLGLSDIQAQEESVRPGINTYYIDPDWQQWVNVFETPGREIYDRRFDILRASAVSPGMDLKGTEGLNFDQLQHISIHPIY